MDTVEETLDEANRDNFSFARLVCSRDSSKIKEDFQKEGMAVYVLEILLIQLCCIFMYFPM